MNNKDIGTLDTPGTSESWRAQLHHSVYKKKKNTES